jgi:hypothetical protein
MCSLWLVFKMAANKKIDKLKFFECVLRSVSGLQFVFRSYTNIFYHIILIFLSGSRWRLWSKMAAKNYKFDNKRVLSLAVYFTSILKGIILYQTIQIWWVDTRWRIKIRSPRVFIIFPNSLLRTIFVSKSPR